MEQTDLLSRVKEHIFDCDYTERTKEDGIVCYTLGFIDGKPSMAWNNCGSEMLTIRCLDGDCYEYVRDKVNEALEDTSIHASMFYLSGCDIVLEFMRTGKTVEYY